MEIKPIGYYIPEFIKRLESRGKTPRLPIHSLPELNRKIWGLPESGMVVIGARTSMGKTAFALQIISDLAYNSVPVLYISFEMHSDEILERIFINRYRIDNFQLLMGNYGDYLSELEDFKNKVKNIKFIITHNFASSWEQLLALLDKYQTVEEKYRAKVIVIDQIQGIIQSKQNQKTFIDDYINNFRIMAKKYKFCGIIISQLNRTNPDSKNKLPQLHQLKGTGFLEEHADMVLLLDYPKRSQTSMDDAYGVYIAKNRTGATGMVKLKFTPQFNLFEDYIEPETKQEQLSKVVICEAWEE